MPHDARAVAISIVGLPPYRHARCTVSFIPHKDNIDDGVEMTFTRYFNTDQNITNEDWLRDVLVALAECF